MQRHSDNRSGAPVVPSTFVEPEGIRRLAGATFLVLAAALVGFGCSGQTSVSTNGTSPDAGTPDTSTPQQPSRLEPVALETKVQNQTIQAGETVDVTCQPVDKNGDPVAKEDVSYGLIVTPTSSFMEVDGPTTIQPMFAGDASVACTSADLGFIDQSPVSLTIEPGEPYVTRASLESAQIQAGGTATAQCSVFDEFGNEITDASPTVELGTDTSGLQIDGRDISATTAGIYEVTCHVDGSDRKVSTPLEVRPGPPANLMLATIPDRQLYARGEVVRFNPMVTDEFGNQIRSADVEFSVSPNPPELTKFGTGRWEFNMEGTYQVSASLESSFDGGTTLNANTEIRVNSEGPAITCDNPADGGIVQAASGSQVTIDGSVSDANGVSSIEIGGNSASLNSGEWSYTTSVDFGINFLDITATDTDGKTSSTTCAFLAADNWHDPASDRLSDAVTLKMTQDAFDDNDRSGSLNSIADLLQAVINSSALENQVDNQLDTPQPIVNDRCFRNFLGQCAAEATITYTPGTFSTGMSNSVSISLEPNGLSFSSTFQDVSLEVNADTETFFGISVYDGPIGLNVSEANVDIDADISLSGGQITANITSASVNIPDGSITITNSNLGLLEGLVENYAIPPIKGTIEGEIESFIKSELETILSDVLDSLDLNTFGQSFDVPGLAGGGTTTTLNFGLGFSSLDVSNQRALIGIETSLNPSEPSYPAAPERVPLPAGTQKLDPSVMQSVGAAAYVGLLNDALHALWRGGMFQVNIGNAFFDGNVPAGTAVNLEMKLPPVANIQSGGGATVSFGSAVVTIKYPGIFDEPLTFRVGADASSDVNLAQGGSQLAFDQVSIDNFYFSPVDARLGPDNRMEIETFLRGLFQNVIDSSLNSALPAVPIPSFRAGSTLSPYLPTVSPSDRLGLKGPTIDQNSTHFIFEGNFGVK